VVKRAVAWEHRSYRIPKLAGNGPARNRQAHRGGDQHPQCQLAAMESKYLGKTIIVNQIVDPCRPASDLARPDLEQTPTRGGTGPAEATSKSCLGEFWLGS
jgi:hypothetical protein